MLIRIYCIYLISDIVSYIFSHNNTRVAAIPKTSLLHAKPCCRYLREFSPCGITCIRCCAITQGFYSNETQHSLYCVDCLPDTYAYGKVWLNMDQGHDGWLTNRGLLLKCIPSNFNVRGGCSVHWNKRWLPWYSIILPECYWYRCWFRLANEFHGFINCG